MILLTDADARANLAVCRGLGTAGLRVAAASDLRAAPAQWSRFCSRRPYLPPVANERRYMDGLVALVEDGSYELLIPGSDQALRVVDTVDSG